MTSTETRGDDSARHRVLVAFAAFGIWWGGWGAALPAVQTNAGVDDGQLGAALLFVAAGGLALMRLTGALLDRFGGVVLPIAAVALGGAGLAPVFAAGFPPLAASLLLIGAASGALDVAINALSARYENTTGRPLMNLAHAGFSVGVIVGAAATGVLRSTGAGPRVVLAVLGLILVLIAGWLSRSAGRAEVPAGTAGAPPPWRWWSPPRRLLVLGLLTALAYLVENAWQSWSAVHLERTLGAAPGIGASGPVLFGAAAAAGRLAGHRLTGRFTEQTLVRAGALVAATGTVVAALAPTVALALAGIALAGVGTAVCAPSLLGLAGRGVEPGRRGSVIGTVTTLAYLGFVLSPAIVGLLARVTSLPVALGSISVAALLLAVFATRASPEAQDESA